jgi:phage antirepressor YoqD-like protein
MLEIFNSQDELFDVSMFDIDQEKQLVNITKIAKFFGKEVSKWNELPSTIKFLNAFNKKSPTSENVVTVRGGNDKHKQGTWVHRKIAIKFAEWINTDFEIWCNDKLDELFQTGSVSLINQFQMPQTFGEALILAGNLQLKVESQTALIETQSKQLEIAKPKSDFFDEVSETKDTFDMQKVAALLKNLGYGRNKLFNKLKELEILQKNNVPYRKYIDLGYFEVKESSRVNPYNGEVHATFQTRVTQKGLVWLQKVLNKEIK